MEKQINSGIEEFIKKLEQKYSICLFFVCETGSRAIGHSQEDSDHDIKGFFISNSLKDYLKIFEKTKYIHKSHEILNDKIEIDYEFFDLGFFFKKVFKKDFDEAFYWIRSNVIYRNLFPFVREFLMKKSIVSNKSFVGKIYSLLNLSIRKNEIPIKKVIHLIIFSTLLFHNHHFSEEIHYKIEEEFQFLKEKFEKNEEKISEENVKVLYELEVLYFKLKEMRKSARKIKINSKFIDKTLLDFANVQIKTTDSMNKKKSLISFTKSQAEEIYNFVLNKFIVID